MFLILSQITLDNGIVLQARHYFKSGYVHIMALTQRGLENYDVIPCLRGWQDSMDGAVQSYTYN